MGYNIDNTEIRSQYELVLQSWEKITYLLISLNGASIGFVIAFTKGTHYTSLLILPFISLFFWSLSIFFGFGFITNTRNMRYFIGKLISENELFSKNANKDEIVQKQEDKLSDADKYQKLFFFLGIILFFAYHIIEIIRNQ